MKPILFNTEMVKAILEGRKTVTRRSPFKFEMKEGYNPEWTGYSLGEYCTGHIETGACLYSRGAHDVWGVRSNVVKPKYVPGDILYVRETWGVETVYGNGGTLGFDAVYKVDNKIIPVIIKDWDRYIEIGKFFDKTGWQPSLFMPKEAARIFLKVTNVKVERLQDITEEQAVNEGITKLYDYLSPEEYKSWSDRVCPGRSQSDWGYTNYLWHGHIGESITGKQSDTWDWQYSAYDNAIDSFSSLWNSTIPVKPPEKLYKYGWKANPWVWVIEFERVDNPELLQEGI